MGVCNSLSVSVFQKGRKLVLKRRLRTQLQPFDKAMLVTLGLNQPPQ